MIAEFTARYINQGSSFDIYQLKQNDVDKLAEEFQFIIPSNANSQSYSIEEIPFYNFHLKLDTTNTLASKLQTHVNGKTVIIQDIIDKKLIRVYTDVYFYRSEDYCKYWCKYCLENKKNLIEYDINGPVDNGLPASPETGKDDSYSYIHKNSIGYI